jgi:peptidoglycan/LPS O-acetylase OafA/YrhL
MTVALGDAERMGSIRLLLAFAVLVSHTTVSEIDIMPGPVAVQFFFIISGFYISLILEKKYKDQGVLLFYSNRLMRLFPTYLVVLFVSMTVLCLLDVGIFTHFDKMKDVYRVNAFVTASLLWTNICVIGQEILFLLKVDQVSGTFRWFLDNTNSQDAWVFLLVPQGWSLSLELYFYLLAPFILKLRNLTIVGLFLLSLALRLYIGCKGEDYDLLARRFFPAELCFFLVGMLSYRLLERIQKSEIKPFVGGYCLAAVVGAILFFPKIALSGSLALAVLLAFLTVPFVFNLTKDSKLDNFLGKLSFPVYMVHFLVIALFEEFWDDYSVFFLLLVVIAAALLIHLLIEVPIDRWRQWRVMKTPSRDVNEFFNNNRLNYSLSLERLKC